MSWSIILLALREYAEEDAASTKRRAARAAEKRREAEGPSDNAPQGGVLAQTEPNDEKSKDLIQKCFNKLWSANSAWAAQVLEDALAYARNSQPRNEALLTRALDQDSSSSVPTSEQEVEQIFGQNVWPSLKTRGWKAEVLTEGPHVGKTQYSFEGKNYYSPQSVLAVAGTIHTELASVVENMTKAVEFSKQKMLETEAKVREQHLSMKPGNIDVDILMDFLRKYSPLQLLHDRKSHKKIHFSRKIFHACTSLHTAKTLVRRAENAPGSEIVVDKLANLLSVDKRMALPHPLWTQKHDGVLIRAIAKHGWIDNETSCRQITKDSSIKWGFPFDSEQSAEDADEGKKTSQREELIRNLKASAERAAEFFNLHNDVIEEVKSFNQNLIIRAYCLVRETANVEDGDEPAESQAQKWTVDYEALVASTGLANATAEAQDFVELPTKKDLVRRAKMVLSRSVGANPSQPAASTIGPMAANGEDKEAPEKKYLVLDQSDRCNVLLAEMLRAIVVRFVLIL